MANRRKLRLISLAMLIIAIIFFSCALSNPTLGQVIVIGGFKLSTDFWYAGYAIYTIVMVTIFVASFFVKDNK